MEITKEDREAGEREADGIYLANSDVLCERDRDIIAGNLTQAFATCRQSAANASEQAVLAKLREHIEHRPMNPILDIAFERWGMIMTGEQLSILTKLVLADALEQKP